MSKTFLKIKIKSLMDEAKHINKEKMNIRKKRNYLLNKQGYEPVIDRCDNIFNSLHNHKQNKLRQESRESHLAYAYVRGKGYRFVENTGSTLKGYWYSYKDNRNEPVFVVNVDNIARMCSKYNEDGITVSKEDIVDWLMAGINEEAVA